MGAETFDVADVRRWEAELVALQERIARYFVRAEPRKLAYDYLRALGSPIERKNGWQIAEHIGAGTPDGSSAFWRSPTGVPTRCGTICSAL